MAGSQILLTTQDAARLEGDEYFTFFKKTQRGKLEVVKTDQRKGRGYVNLISIDQLTEKARRKWYEEQGLKVEKPKTEPDKRFADIELTDLTGKQREKASMWEKIIKDWRLYIEDYPLEKTAKTEEYVEVVRKQNPGLKISARTLWRKWDKLKLNGEVAIADFRGRYERKGAIPDIVWTIFLEWWLDENQPTVTSVYRILSEWLEKNLPEMYPLPSVSTFAKNTNKIPVPVIKYFRHGQKAYEDECMPYLSRMLENLDSNEIWSADYHTLDFFVRDDYTGTVYRPHIVVWIDIRSRKMLSVTISDSANSDGVIVGLRKAIERYGIPTYLYLDNGKEFLNHAFGGRGIRKSDPSAEYGTTILERLGITMHNAMPGNAKAKVIEREFKNVCNDFSRYIDTYCGGSPDKRPDRLEGIIKEGKKIPLLSEIRTSLELYIEGWYNNQPSKASGLQGKSPNQCYDENLIKKRTARSYQLDLMMLRSERLQTVTRNGVKVRISGIDTWFYDEELVQLYMGHKVYVRYNPEALDIVHVYNEQEARIGTAELIKKAEYDFGGEITKERIKEVNSRKKAMHKFVKGFKDTLTKPDIEIPTALEALMEVSQARLDGMVADPDPQIIEPIDFGKEETAMAMTGTDDDGIVDLDRMIANAKKGRN